MLRRIRSAAGAVALALLLSGMSLSGAGCASNRGVERGPEALEALHAARPALSDHDVNLLLPFEGDDDVFRFVEVVPDGARVDRAVFHSGGASLYLPAGTQHLVIKLPGLLGRQPFPGDWLMFGLHLHAERPTRATVSYTIDGRAERHVVLTLSAGRWAPVMLDLVDLPITARRTGALVVRFHEPLAAPVRVDDVVLVNNDETIVSPDAAGTKWLVRRRGTRITIESPTVFRLKLVTCDALPQGWRLVEAGTLRARFASTGGEAAHLTVYDDGRAYRDGSYDPLGKIVRDDPAYAAAHAAPATLRVPVDLGRVNRSSDGDANNDGYNERLGAYQLIAAGPRFDVQIRPVIPTVPRPVLQIAGLPRGRALVTVEGQLVQRTQRLDNGDLLVEVPVRIERPTIVNVRVRAEVEPPTTEDGN